MDYLIRFGQIGDVITAAETSIELNAKLIVCESKRVFFSRKNNNGYQKLLNIIENRFNINIQNITFFSLKKIIKNGSKKRNSRIFLMTQSISAYDKIFCCFLSLLLLNRVELLNEGTQTFFGSLKRSRDLFLKRMSVYSDCPLTISIVWDGKERQKNLNQKQIHRFIDLLIEFFPNSKIYILGKTFIDLDNKHAVNKSGNTTLNEAFNFIEKSNMVISVDTGLLHYAVFKNIPTIAIIAHRLRLANWFPASSPTALISPINSENKYKCVKDCHDCILNKEINDINVSYKLRELLMSI